DVEGTQTRTVGGRRVCGSGGRARRDEVATAAGGRAVAAAGQSDGGDERERAQTGSQSGGPDRIEGIRGRAARGRAAGKRPSPRPGAGGAGAVSRPDAAGAAGTARLRSR